MDDAVGIGRLAGEQIGVGQIARHGDRARRLDCGRGAVAAASARTVWPSASGAARTPEPTSLVELCAGQRAVIGSLVERSAGGGLADRPRVAVVDALTGTLLALTDARELRRLATCDRSACARRKVAGTHDLDERPGLAPPGPTEGYRPGRELDRFVRARDRRCRFPGCRNRVTAGGQLDHDTVA